MEFNPDHHNFLDTHSDICHCNQGIEDVSHFLFLSPSFTTQRVAINLQRNYLNHLSNQSELSLYGYRPINVIDDKKNPFVDNTMYKGSIRYSVVG